MCDPVTLGSALLLGGSTFLNSQQQRAQQSARDDAMTAERMRQQQLDQEALALNTQSQDRFADTETDRAERKIELTDYFSPQTVSPVAAAPAIAASSSNVTLQETAKQAELADAFGAQQGGALAELRSFGDVLGTAQRGAVRDAGQIGQIGGFKRSSAGLLGGELQEANSAGAGYGLAADLTRGAGSLGLNYGLSGANKTGFRLNPFGAVS